MHPRLDPRRAGTAFAAIAVVCLALPVQAQDSTETRLREALRETAAKLRTTEAALAQQQSATAAAERERDAAKQAPAPKADDARVAALQRQLAAAGGEAGRARAERDTLQAAQQQATQAAQRKEIERAALAGQLAQLRAQSAKCAAGNDAFYATGREIAALYRDPAFIDFARGHRRELLGFDRIKQENRVRALEDKLADQQAQAQRCRDPGAAPANDAAPATAGGAG